MLPPAWFRAWIVAVLTVLGTVAAAPALAEPGALRWHTVVQGQRLDSIAKRYQVSIDAICAANGISRHAPIRIGQRLAIPDRDDPDGTKTRAAVETAERAKAPGQAGGNGAAHDELQVLDVPGAPRAYYFEPSGPGRNGLKPVFMYLHARGGDPANDCRRWARIARRMGWIVCPSGPEDRGGGARGWNNAWPSGHRIAMATLAALRDKYGRRVQTRGNTIIGFSEGALVAMNVGVREPQTFSRWLILAADTGYWGMEGREKLVANRGAIRRVYLITGQQDSVYESTLQVRQWLQQAHVTTRVSTPADMGHELALESRSGMYQAALVWLEKGTPR
jgi:predicted esterase/LysM repeat protein